MPEMYGGYTAEQLRANPALVGKLGQHGAAKWAATNPAPIPPRPATGPPVTSGAPPQPGGAAPPMPGGAPSQPGAGSAKYGGYTEAELLANPELVKRLGPHAAGRWAKRGANAPTPAPAPAPPPAAPTPGPPVGGPAPAPGGPPAGGPGPGAGGPSPFPDYPGAPAGGPMLPGVQNEFTDPMMMFLSAVPAMRLNTQKQISDAVSQAGMSGNRWGTSAQRAVGQIGAEAGMQENALLSSLLSDYANNQENRALQATGQGMQLGGLLDQLAKDRVQMPFGVGAYEQGRQDDFAKRAYEDFEQNKLGWLDRFLPAAASQGAGSPAQPGQIISVPGEAAKPGGADWLTLLAGLFS